jgi:hypothetical protein
MLRDSGESSRSPALILHEPFSVEVSPASSLLWELDSFGWIYLSNSSDHADPRSLPTNVLTDPGEELTETTTESALGIPRRGQRVPRFAKGCSRTTPRRARMDSDGPRAGGHRCHGTHRDTKN